MTIHGSILSLPFRSDARGTLTTTSDRAEIVRQSVRSILSTRMGERLMLPDYGIPDFAFAVRGVGFAAAVSHFLRAQILKYEPLVQTVSVRDGSLVAGDSFSPELAGDEHAAAVEVVVTLRGSNTPLNLVFPLWEYRA
ncbi:MAG TPA: GPW/gp25 family protein [Pyrinomonadaceae bacterium]